MLIPRVVWYLTRCELPNEVKVCNGPSFASGGLTLVIASVAEGCRLRLTLSLIARDMLRAR